MLPRSRKADLQNVSAAVACVQDDPATAVAMGVDDLVNRRAQARLREGLDNQAAFPAEVPQRLPVLDGAAAAESEMRAQWCNAIGVRSFDVQQTPPVRMTGNAFNRDAFARQCVGHENRTPRRLCHPVSAVADAIDDQSFAHWMLVRVRGGRPPRAHPLGHTENEKERASAYGHALL